MGQKYSRLCEISDSLLKAEAYDKVLAMSNRLIAIESANQFGYYYRSLAYYYLGNYKKCDADCDKITELGKQRQVLNTQKEFQLYYIQACSNYSLHNWEKSIRYYTKYFSIMYDSYDTYFYRGYAYYYVAKFDSAIIDLNLYYENGYLSKADSISVCFFLGECYNNINNVDSASKFLQICLQIDSSSTYSKCLKADLNFDLKKYSIALPIYESLYKKDSSNYYVDKLAYCYYDLGNYEISKKLYILSSKKSVYKSHPYNMIACILYVQKKYLQALNFANKSVSTDSENDNAFDTRGCIYFKLNNFQMAIKDFNRSLKLNPEYWNSYYYRGRSYLSLKMKSNACLDFEKLQNNKDYSVPNGEPSIHELIGRTNN